ncbi:MAG: ThiJ/PfpI family protein [Amycolatopsis sp.]|jgi:transcriptional regulator GlxA family with amidase domain|uniref:DJ-1/PfpI family protein n=1 Tax=Amycolatopsis sp. TaxID=37632 RepID=UPI002623F3B6|nr:DJ-1/PfpI family protein [Amycolatopsis sp.]MCU1686878.1 ThiJ/PfpI family protein [Amycolatopsis sp.]
MADDEKTIAFVLYPGLTLLDLAGPLQVLSVLAHSGLGYRAVVVGERAGAVDTDTPLGIAPSHTFAEVPHPFAIVVPGGAAPTLRALGDERLLTYLREASATAEWTTSVCTGSLLLGAAGLLDGKRATTHWMYREILRGFGAVPVAERWVEDTPVITAAGVAAGIDMALYLVGRLAGDEVARNIQFTIEYDPEPPLGGLDWDLAPQVASHLGEGLKYGLADNPDMLARLLPYA